MHRSVLYPYYDLINNDICYHGVQVTIKSIKEILGAIISRKIYLRGRVIAILNELI